jgi:hypothetical protein
VSGEGAVSVPGAVSVEGAGSRLPPPVVRSACLLVGRDLGRLCARELPDDDLGAGMLTSSLTNRSQRA